MTRRFVSFAVLLLSAWVACATPASRAETGSSSYPSLFAPGPLRDSVLTGIHWTENEQFDLAESLFVSIYRDYPDSPIGPLFVAAAIHGEMLDSESDERSREFRQWLTWATVKADRWRTDDGDNAEPEFILGAAFGYNAVYESHWGGWFAALKRGLAAKKHFARAVELDSTLIDAYLGLGTYNYWKSVKTNFINWLPIIPDNRDKGLAQLHRVMYEGVFSRNAARASLCHALMNEQDYSAALAHAETLMVDLPDAKSPLWIQAEAIMALYRWSDAAALYDTIAARILQSGPGNYYNLIECAAQQAHALAEAGLYRRALAVCHEGLSYDAPAETLRRQKRTLDQLRERQRELKNLTQPE